MPGSIVFGRRAERAAYAQVEGQPGAAAAALGVLRRGWNVQQAVAVTKNQDLVHRVVGRPGVILVGEGNPARVRHLLGVEKKKHARVVGEASRSTTSWSPRTSPTASRSRSCPST